MSGKRTKDYYEVLRCIDRQLPRDFSLEQCVLDFEAAVWQAIRSRYPDTRIQGCGFHWAQTVFRKVQEIGLQTAYNERGDVYGYLRRVMSLSFLSAEQIAEAFNKLDDRATSPPLQRLIDYISRTWVRSRSWSVYMTAIRANNDVEGWHNRLNSRVNIRGPVPCYLLVQELFKESQSIPLQCQMVTEDKLARYQRKKSRDAQRDVFSLWTRYSEGTLTTSELLKKIGRHLH